MMTRSNDPSITRSSFLHALAASADDLRLAARQLRRRPGFAFLAVVMIALGIGANAALFGVADAVLLRPLPYQDADDLRMLWPSRSFNKEMVDLAQAELRGFDGVAAYASWSFPIAFDGGAERVDAAVVSDNFFQVLGAVPPAAGRYFGAGASTPGEDRVVVLGQELWRTRFGADPGVVGTMLEVDGTPHEIVGVVGAEHRPLLAGWQLWKPYGLDRSGSDYTSSFYLKAFGRLAADARTAEAGGADASAAQAVADFSDRMHAHNPQYYSPPKEAGPPSVVTMREHAGGEHRTLLASLLGATALVLLVACANVAHLLLVRADGRRGELAVRSALGAGGGSLVRMVLLESAVLAVLGGLLGVGVAGWVQELFVARLPAELAGADVRVDHRIFVFALGLTTLSALVAGLAPAFRAARQDPREAFGGERGVARGGSSLRRLLPVAEIAGSVALLVVAGLLLTSLDRLADVDPGFDAADVVTFRVDAPHAAFGTPESQRALEERLRSSVESLAGVAAVGTIQVLPMSPAGNWSFPYWAEGQPFPEGSLPFTNFRTVGGDYFDALDIELLAGRVFDGRDVAESLPVVVINRRLAEVRWPELAPAEVIGQTLLRFGSEPLEVVGVVADVRQHALRLEPMPEMYQVASQWPVRGFYVAAEVEDGLRPAALAGALRAAVDDVDPTLAVSELASMPDLLADSVAQTRFAANLVACFALLGLILGATGVCAVVAYGVERRRRELGIRIALGADAARVVRSVTLGALGLCAGGQVVGLLLALGAGRAMGSLLFGVEATDPAVFGIALATVTVATLVGAWWPARRASRVDPMVVLREE